MTPYDKIRKALNTGDANDLLTAMDALAELEKSQTPAPVADIREPTPEECERIYWAMRRCGYDPKDEASRGLAMFDAVRAVMWPKLEGS